MKNTLLNYNFEKLYGQDVKVNNKKINYKKSKKKSTAF